MHNHIQLVILIKYLPQLIYFKQNSSKNYFWKIIFVAFAKDFIRLYNFAAQGKIVRSLFGFWSSGLFYTLTTHKVWSLNWRLVTNARRRAVRLFWCERRNASWKAISQHPRKIFLITIVQNKQQVLKYLRNENIFWSYMSFKYGIPFKQIVTGYQSFVLLLYRNRWERANSCKAKRYDNKVNLSIFSTL